MTVHIPRKQGGRKRERPTDEKLAALYAQKSTAEVAKILNVSERTVANWVADVRRREKEEQEAQKVKAVDTSNWIKIVQADYPGRLTAILEIGPNGEKPYYVIINGANPGDERGKGSAQTTSNFTDAQKKYAQIIRSRADTES